jgi:hypothetical protein
MGNVDADGSERFSLHRTEPVAQGNEMRGFIVTTSLLDKCVPKEREGKEFRPY